MFLSFFFFFLAIGLCYFFTIQSVMIYSGVPQNAQFCLFYMAVFAYSAYSKIAKSSPPQNKSSNTNIFSHAGNAPQSCLETGHATALSAPPRKMEYSVVR